MGVFIHHSLLLLIKKTMTTTTTTTTKADLTQAQKAQKLKTKPWGTNSPWWLAAERQRAPPHCSILEDIWVKIKDRVRKRLSNIK